jgi:2-amino-4-hydroxy-6-hydroxymethyldihydropteridine diphosphokinase
LPRAAGSATDPVVVAIALGSNLGDRERAIARAVARLRAVLDEGRVSRVLETPAEGVPSPQPPYLNAALVGRTQLPPQPLLERLQAIEHELGRERPFHRAPRTIDLDLILYGAATISEPDLTVPHPRFRERFFVLAPLAEIAPELIDPVTGLTMSALLDELNAGR